MSKPFEGKYTVADGYANQTGRPHSFDINEKDIEDDMTQDDLYELFANLMYEAFADSITPEADNDTEFVKWAKGVIESRPCD